MTDESLNSFLEEALDSLPPDKTAVGTVSPWERGMGRFIAGLLLTVISIGPDWLRTGCGLLGMYLIFLSLRPLRQNGKWLRTAYVLSLLRLIAALLSALLAAAWVWPGFEASAAGKTALYMLAFLSWGVIVCFSKGICALCEQMELGDGPQGPPIGLALWYSLLALLAVLNVSGWIPVILLLGLVGVVKSLVKLSENMELQRYSLETAPPKLSDRSLSLGCLAFLVLGLLAVSLSASGIPTLWQEIPAELSSEASAARDKLETLGAPAALLADLTEEDLRSLETAETALVKRWEPLAVREDNGPAAFTAVLLRLGPAASGPDETEDWRLLLYFSLPEGMAVKGNDGLQAVINESLMIGDPEKILAETHSVLRCRDRNGQELFAALTPEAADNGLWQVIHRCGFSCPEKAVNVRGYTLLPLERTVRRDTDTYSWLTLSYQLQHQQRRTYPLMTGNELLKAGESHKSFKTSWWALYIGADDGGMWILDVY